MAQRAQQARRKDAQANDRGGRHGCSPGWVALEGDAAKAGHDAQAGPRALTTDAGLGLIVDVCASGCVRDADEAAAGGLQRSGSGGLRNLFWRKCFSSLAEFCFPARIPSLESLD